MTIAGVNLGSTFSGRSLRDGACVTLGPEGIYGIAEERLTRQKHGGGYSLAAPYAISASGGKPADLELVVATSCCEGVRTPDSIDLGLGGNIPVATIHHHEAHAWSAAIASGFDECLVAVLDGGGNTLDQCSCSQWWKHPREQASYYVWTDGLLELVDRDFSGPEDVGFGEMYRAFTHYLGWPSSVYAGNTMALAGLHDNDPGHRLWQWSGTNIHTMSGFSPDKPIATVIDACRRIGLDPPKPCQNPAELRPKHAELAAVLQRSLEDALLTRVTSLVERTGVSRVALAGGVALNCVANSVLACSDATTDVFVQPAAGDTGQALGAFYSAANSIGLGREVLSADHIYLGAPYHYNEVEEALKHFSESRNDLLILEPTCEAASRVAKLLEQGLRIAWFEGRSEYGPRALGSRSILADPRSEDSKKQLRETKGRDHFLPFAPAVLERHWVEYFYGAKSTTMTFVSYAKPEAWQKVPGVIHEDGSARVQVVDATSPAGFQSVIEAFNTSTEIPMVLNTSLNLRGEPIAETPGDALDVFDRSDLDGIYLDGYLVIRD